MWPWEDAVMCACGSDGGGGWLEAGVGGPVLHCCIAVVALLGMHRYNCQ